MMHRLAVFAVLSWISGSVVIAAEFTTVAGRTLKGQPTKFENGVVSFSTAEGMESIPLKDLLAINFGGKLIPADKYELLELTDGSRLRISSVKIPGKSIAPTFINPSGEPKPPTVTLSLANTFTLLRGAESSTNRDAWKKLVDGRGKRDLFVSRSTDGVLSVLPGTVIDGTTEGDAVNFEREDGQRTVLQLRRATGGIVFNPPLQGVIAPTIGQAFDVFGNELFIQSMTFNGNGLTVKTVHGATLAYDSTAAIIRLDFSQGNIAYLSSLDPTVTAPKPTPGEPYFTYLKDRAQDNSPIRLSGVTYPRGLWVAPDVSLSFKLTADYREFKTIVGIDDGIERPDAQVKLVIEGDGRKLFDAVVSRKDPPRDLTLDVKGVRELKLSVSAGSLFQGNQVTLANARLQK